MKDELKEFIEICDCKEIQDKCIDTKDWACSFCGLLCNEIIIHKCNGDIIKLPTIDQLLEIMGDRFDGMYFTNKTEWCVTYQSKLQENGMYMIETVKGQSARIALAKAVKERENGK